jgi:hypothetical protein
MLEGEKYTIKGKGENCPWSPLVTRFRVADAIRRAKRRCTTVHLLAAAAATVLEERLALVAAK